MPPIVCHSTRACLETHDFAEWIVRQATQSSKSLVNRDFGRAHGTSSTRTPSLGQSTRTGAYSR